MASTLQLEFAQAMSDFKTMFPEMERDVIEAVLRANQGAVDATIDQLLAMSTDNQVHNSSRDTRVFLGIYEFWNISNRFAFQNEKLRNELEQNASNSLPPYDSILDKTTIKKDSILPVSLAAGRSMGASRKVKNDSPAHLSSHNKWDPPLLCPLPSTFLRLTNEVCIRQYTWYYLYILSALKYCVIAFQSIGSK